jgi:sRNA-binding protein
MSSLLPPNSLEAASRSSRYARWTRANARKDTRYGVDGKDTDLPAELDRRETRLARLQATRAQIEAEAAEKARAHAEDKERRRQQRAVTPTSRRSPTSVRPPRTPRSRNRRRRPTSPTPSRGS